MASGTVYWTETASVASWLFSARPVRRSAARASSGARRGEPAHPGRRRQPRLLDRGAGDAAGARDQFAALLPVLRVLGPEHPGTLAARHELARWTGETASSPGPGVD